MWWHSRFFCRRPSRICVWGLLLAMLGVQAEGLDGTLIYSRNTSPDGAIWAYDTVSGTNRFLTWGARPIISPDGKWLAFWREFRDGNPLLNYGNLFIRELAKGTETRIYFNNSQ